MWRARTVAEVAAWGVGGRRRGPRAAENKGYWKCWHQLTGLIATGRLSYRAYVLYGVLQMHAGRFGSATLHLRTLASELRCSRAAVKRALRELRSLGLVRTALVTNRSGTVIQTYHVLDPWEDERKRDLEPVGP